MAAKPSWEIEANYIDASGRHRHVDPVSLALIASALGAVGGEALAPFASTVEVAHQPDLQDKGAWLLAVQLYGVRSRRNWGHGDFTDLRHLLEIAAQAGAAGIGLNPLHALFAHEPQRASPYSPSSRYFLNPLYIDVDGVPEFSGLSVEAQQQLDALRQFELVNYLAVSRIKWAALRDAYDNFRTGQIAGRREEFDAFLVEGGERLHRFAVFEALREHFQATPFGWPANFQSVDAPAIAQFAESHAANVEFHAYVQWLADTQLRQCRNRARDLGLPIGLYIDLAVGVDAGGADVWSGPDDFARGLSIGAPPDILNVAGQNWGLASFHPVQLIEKDFRPFAELLAANMRHAGAVRIDHVLGLNRLFLIPHGQTADHGAYVRLPFDAMLDVVCAASEAARCLVIGEDLGTVPEGFREKLNGRGIWSSRVLMFERDESGAFLEPGAYPARALASFGTHDLATYAGWHGGHDLKAKQAISVDPGETAADRDTAQSALARALEHHGLANGGAVQFSDVARYLARSRSRLIAIAIEDVLGVIEQPNIPGTIHEHPNWMRRVPLAIENLASDERFRAVAEALAAEGRSSVRIGNAGWARSFS